MKHTLPLLFLIFIISCGSQKLYSQEGKKVNYIPYYLKVYEADSLYLTQNYQESFQILDKLFQEYEPLDMDLYYEYNKYIELAVQLNKIDFDYNKHVSKLISDFGYNKVSFEDGNSNIAYKKAKIDDAKFKDLREKYLKNVNFTLRDTIINMVKNDQLFRNDYKANSNKIDSIEKINEKLLLYIFDKYGYPSTKKIGNNMITGKREKINIDAIIIHQQNSEKFHIIEEKIFEFVKNGECLPLVYASFIDRHLMLNDKPQKYGVWETGDENFNKKQQNENRKKIGLYSIK